MLDCTSGLYAFAHPSPISIGETHGVFVVPAKNNYSTCNIVPCTKFLHKPSVKVMQEHEAIIENEMVWTDSSYFFMSDVTQRLLEVIPKIPNLVCETDCYGDLLQPLGTNPYLSYIDTKNANRATVQKILQDALKTSPFFAICCKPSKFYHIGTMQEYIEHLGASTDYSPNESPLLFEIGANHLTFSSVHPSEYVALLFSNNF